MVRLATETARMILKIDDLVVGRWFFQNNSLFLTY